MAQKNGLHVSEGLIFESVTIALSYQIIIIRGGIRKNTNKIRSTDIFPATFYIFLGVVLLVGPRSETLMVTTVS